jgi:hypothetical protein
MAAQSRYHVAPTEAGQWIVEREANHWVSDPYGSQREALRAGRDLAEAARPAQLIVHGPDGHVEAQYSYIAVPGPLSRPRGGQPAADSPGTSP